jgi:hypothetical protein
VVGRTVDDVVRHYLSETGGEAGVRPGLTFGHTANHQFVCAGLIAVPADGPPPDEGSDACCNRLEKPL